VKVELAPATNAEFPIVQNLGRLYVYDLSEFMGWPCPPSGLFGCRNLSEYWTEPGASPFVIRYDGELAGFALVNDKGNAPETDYNMGEFFVLRKFRAQGVGTQAATLLFRRLLGLWEVMQLPPNKPAITFWRKVIGEYTEGDYTESREMVAHIGFDMIIQRFDSDRRKGARYGP
jgi:predicted acetyltransferase